MKLGLLMLLILSAFLVCCSPSTEELYSKADRLIEKEQYAKAIKVYDEILERSPQFQDAYYNKGWCYLQDSNYKRALFFFELVLQMKKPESNSEFIFELNPDSPIATEEENHQIPLNELYYQIAVTKYYMDSIQVSYRTFQRCIDRNYEKGSCFLWQGIIWMDVDSTKIACDLFQKAKFWGEEDAERYLKEYCQKSNE
jgi:tetratricopeptide (TPR) repeat protein